jgi:hypothetical protein
MPRQLTPPPPPPDNPFDALGKLPEVCETLAAWLDYVNEVTDSSSQTIKELARTKPEIFPALQHRKGKGCRLKVKGQSLAKFAGSAALKWGPVSAQLLVDGQTVRLSRTLGMLAELLLDDDRPPSPQARAGWKSRQDLRLRLAKRTGREMSKHTFENLLSRLKGALGTQAQLDWLVETGGPLGVRFALQKYVSGADPTSGNGGKADPEQGKNETDYGAYWGEI